MIEKKKKKITKARFKRAILKTGGIKTIIAKKLDCSWNTVSRILQREGWEDVAEAYEEERERVGDLAEETIMEGIRQRVDVGEATKNARWYLATRHRDRGYGEHNVVTLRGQKDAPLQIAHTHINVSELDLSLEVKKAILEAVEKREMKQIPEKTGDKDNTSPGDDS